MKEPRHNYEEGALPAANIVGPARVLWEYLSLDMPVPLDADLLLVCGSHDKSVALRAAELALKGSFRTVVVSGGAGKITSGAFARPEAEVFRGLMVAAGVPLDRVLMEVQAHNSGENITLTRQLLGQAAESVGSGLLVTKPYMERRLFATASKQWPGVKWSVTSPRAEMEDYLHGRESTELTLNLMVGDLQRIDVYAEKGFQIPQEIPEEAWAAFRELVALGFDAQVMR